METFYSKYPLLRLVGKIGDRRVRIDFSGGEVWPKPGAGMYETDDVEIISWLEGHPSFGIDFDKEPFAPPTTPPERVYTDEEILDMLIDSVVMVP